MSEWLSDKMQELDRELCAYCANYYKSLGHHWRHTPNCAPQLSDKQEQIVTGLLMGDGHLDVSSKNPYIKSDMVTFDYLDYLDSEFPVMGRGVELVNSAKESATRAKETGFHDGALEKNYSDVYGWRTYRNPNLHTFDNWYKPNKCWPEDIRLTSTVLKHWYVCDGTLKDKDSIGICADNENQNADKLINYFTDADLPEPNTNVYSRPDDAWSNSDRLLLSWGFSDSSQLFNYIGEPLPGFEYKWPDQNT